MSTRVRSPTLRTMSFSSNDLNPAASALTSYEPFGRLGSTNWPAVLLVVLKFAPVAVWVALIETPGTTAPVGSDTVPTIVACWAEAWNTKASRKRQHGNT